MSNLKETINNNNIDKSTLKPTPPPIWNDSLCDDFTYTGNNNDNNELSYKKQAYALRRGDFVLLDGHPCQIIDMSCTK